MWALDLARQLRAELEAAVFPVLGVFLDQEPLAVRVEFRIDLDDGPADGQDPGYAFEILDAQLGQFSPAQAGFDVRLGQQFDGPSGSSS